MTDQKKCILCGCRDHRLIGCAKHFSKNVIVIIYNYFLFGPDLS